MESQNLPFVKLRWEHFANGVVTPDLTYAHSATLAPKGDVSRRTSLFSDPGKLLKLQGRLCKDFMH